MFFFFNMILDDYWHKNWELRGLLQNRETGNPRGGCWEECCESSGCWRECWRGCCSWFLSKDKPPRSTLASTPSSTPNFRSTLPSTLPSYCGYPLLRYTCRATRVAADFLDFIAFCRCSTGVALHPLKILVSHLPPPCARRCRTETWVWKGVALHGGVAATVAGVALHCATKGSPFLYSVAGRAVPNTRNAISRAILKVHSRSNRRSPMNSQNADQDFTFNSGPRVSSHLFEDDPEGCWSQWASETPFLRFSVSFFAVRVCESAKLCNLWNPECKLLCPTPQCTPCPLEVAHKCYYGWRSFLWSWCHFVKWFQFVFWSLSVLACQSFLMFLSCWCFRTHLLWINLSLLQTLMFQFLSHCTATFTTFVSHMFLSIKLFI